MKIKEGDIGYEKKQLENAQEYYKPNPMPNPARFKKKMFPEIT